VAHSFTLGCVVIAQGLDTSPCATICLSGKYRNPNFRGFDTVQHDSTSVLTTRFHLYRSNMDCAERQT